MELFVGKTASFCFGVNRAVSGTAKELLNSNCDTYCLGELVHNEQVINDLKSKGLTIIETLDEIPNPKSSKVIIRAHGITKEMYDKCSNLDLDILDFTCPNVLNIHKIATEYSSKGFYIFLIGIKNHPESIGTFSFCGNNSSIIENQEDLDIALNSFYSSNLKNLLIISQTTFSVEKFNNLVALTRNSIDDNINLVVKNTICNTTKLRQDETETLSKSVDLMIIIGGKKSSNTRKLFDIANKNCKNSILVQTFEDIDLDYIMEFNKIGIMAGASTPVKSITDIVNYIKKN